MATIRPFRGLRFTGSAGDPSDLTAPPYDVISPEMREELAGKNKHNIVGLTLPESQDGDRSKFVKYARAAQRLQEWRTSDILQNEEKPALYRYRQVFTTPDGQEHERTKIVALIKVQPYSEGAVLPHERTFPKHKEDRMRILEATRAHVESIFGLFEDEDGSRHQAIADAPHEVVASLTDDDGTLHEFAVISDEDAIKRIVDGVAGSTVWIADGHHRYETALAFREKQGEQDSDIAEDYMMMALCSISDPGLALLPTHRILKRMPVDAPGLKARLSEHFDLEDCPNGELMARLENHAEGCAFGVALPGGTGVLAVAKDKQALVNQVSAEGGDALKNLDVTILHEVIFGGLLGLAGNDFFGYTRSETEAVEAVEDDSPASFLMNPPSVDDMKAVAAAGDFMPQKSTYYYPKLQSGLVLWSLADF